MAACAGAPRVAAGLAIAASAAVMTTLRSIMAAPLALVSDISRILRGRLAQRNDEIGSFAGFAGGDALIGNDDRAAGRKRVRDARHRVRGDRDAIQRLGRAVGLGDRLYDLDRAGDLAVARGALVV